MLLVDSHCHLDFPDFADDLESVIANAKAHGVGVMQTICTKMNAFERINDLAERFDGVYCSVGVHPHEVDKAPLVTTAELVEKTRHRKVIGIGESGLDYYYEHSPRELQQESFRQHIAAARETGLPIIVHSRNADEDTATIMAEEMEKGAYPGLIHCFSSTRALADRSLELGFYISISGIITFKKSEELRAVVVDVPLDRLLVETDAPYLAPMPHRGKRNEPSFTRHTNALLAGLKEMSEEDCARATTDNFFRLFTKAERPSTA